jgi:hypothetical protein
MYVPGGRWRFFGRFNHGRPAMATQWWQLDEKWMVQYLKPQLVKDMFEEAKAMSRLNVQLTGNKVGEAVLECVKQCVLHLIPKSDSTVREVVSAWDDEVHFEQTVSRLCDLKSDLFQYNTQRLKMEDFFDMMDNPWDAGNFDAIVRPADQKGNG